MNEKPKYELFEKVYYMSGNMIIAGIVIGYLYGRYRTYETKSFFYIVRHSEDEIDPGSVREHDFYSEYGIFPTKEELLKSLMDKSPKETDV